MAKETINIGDTGQELVDKLANNFNELYDGKVELFMWDGKTHTQNPNNIAIFQKIYDTYIKEQKPVAIITSGSWSSHGVNFNNTPTLLVPIRVSASQIIFRSSPIWTDTSSLSMTYSYVGSATVNFNASGEVTSIGAVGFSLTILPNSSQACFRWNGTAGGGIGTGECALTLNNAKEFNPTQPYHPATKKYIDDKVDAIETLKVRTFNYVDPNNDYFIFDEQEAGIIFLNYSNSPYGMFKWKYLSTTSPQSLSVPSNLPIYYIKKYSDAVNNEIFCYFYNTTTGEYCYLKKTSSGANASYANDNWVNLNKPQSIYGEKEFTVLPKSTVVPTNDAQFTNKKYVDDNAGFIGMLYDTNSQDNAPSLEGLSTGVYALGLGQGSFYGGNNCYVKRSSEATVSNIGKVGDCKIYIFRKLTPTTPNKTAFAIFRNSDGALCELETDSTYAGGIKVTTNNSLYTYMKPSVAATISGQHTFSTLPKSTVVPTNDAQLVNKKYVDDEIANLKAELLGGVNNV